jgi:integrase
MSAVKIIAAGCGFSYWTDISAVKVEAYLKELRDKKEGGIGYRRSNAYLTALKMFANWMIEQGRSGESPIRHLKGLNAKLDQRHQRRGLGPDEIRRLLVTTKAGPFRFGMTGATRALLYRLAAESGLRRSELHSLKTSSFDFENLTVTVSAAYSKNKKESTLPLRRDTALELKQYLAGKLPTEQAFNTPYRTADMLKEDLKDAKIDYQDAAGRYADFHCLRHTCGTLLAAAGVHPKTAQSIMRHSTIELTMGIYTHTLVGQEAQAVESLPDFGASESKQTLVKAG